MNYKFVGECDPDTPLVRLHLGRVILGYCILFLGISGKYRKNFEDVNKIYFSCLEITFFAC